MYNTSWINRTEINPVIRKPYQWEEIIKMWTCIFYTSDVVGNDESISLIVDNFFKETISDWVVETSHIAFVEFNL